MKPSKTLKKLNTPQGTLPIPNLPINRTNHNLWYSFIKLMPLIIGLCMIAFAIGIGVAPTKKTPPAPVPFQIAPVQKPDIDSMVFDMSDLQLLHAYAAVELELEGRRFEPVHNYAYPVPFNQVFEFTAVRDPEYAVGTNGVFIFTRGAPYAQSYRWNYWTIQTNGNTGWKDVR
jgi:hypothetical protein